MRRIIVGILPVVLLLGVSSPAVALKGNCWGELKAPLEKGEFFSGYTPATDCSDFYDFDLRYLGRTTGKRPYRVYVAGYTLFGVEGGPGHGVERILLFDDRLNYIGNYRVSVDDRHLSVRGLSIHLSEPARYGNVIRLDSYRPPRKLLFGGEDIWLQPGRTLREPTTP